MPIFVQTPKYFDENGNELEAENKTYGTSNFISVPSNVKTIYFKLAQASSYTFEQTVDVPINAKYLRYSNYNGSNKNDEIIKMYITLLDIYWMNLKMGVIGDSITAGTYTPKGGSSPNAVTNEPYWKIAAFL